MRNYAIVALRNKAQRQRLDETPEMPARTGNPEIEFSRVWANELLQEVLKELKTECSRKGKKVHWQLFQEWLLEPDVEADNIRLADIGARHGVNSPSRAYNMISNIKDRFRAILRMQLLPLVESEEEIDAEIAYFVSLFSQESTRS